MYLTPSTAKLAKPEPSQQLQARATQQSAEQFDTMQQPTEQPATTQHPIVQPDAEPPPLSSSLDSPHLPTLISSLDSPHLPQLSSCLLDSPHLPPLSHLLERPHLPPLSSLLASHIRRGITSGMKGMAQRGGMGKKSQLPVNDYSKLHVDKTVELPWHGKGGKEVYWNAIITEGNYILYMYKSTCEL